MAELEVTLRSWGPPSAGATPDASGLAARAADEGLLDVAYASVDSPFGPMLAAATPRGLVRLAYDAAHPDAVLAELADNVSPRVLEAPARLDAVRRELEEYFEGRRREFDLPLDWRLSRGYVRRVLRQIARVGYGRVVTYGELAARAGSPRGARAAGNAAGSNPIPIVVPCHRVVRSGGAIGGYGRELRGYRAAGRNVKLHLLELEGALDERGRALVNR